jgi:uridylate kinase
LTNVRGLYSENPKKNKKAKFISKISWKEFLKIAEGVRYEAGQHFVLDLVAAQEILKNKTDCYIVGNLKAVDSVLLGKRFDGTLISG